MKLAQPLQIIDSSAVVHRAIRYADYSVDGTPVEVIVGNTDEAMEYTFIGENGWERIVPTPQQKLVASFQRKLGSRPWGPLFRAALLTTQGKWAEFPSRHKRAALLQTI